MMGAPVVIVPERYVLARSVVAGRFVNAFCTTDWTLSLNFRARSVRRWVQQCCQRAALVGCPGTA